MGNSSKEEGATPSGWPEERASFSNTGESTVFLFPKPTGKGAIYTNFPVLPIPRGSGFTSLPGLGVNTSRADLWGSRMLAELTGDITQERWAGEAEFTFLLCPHSLCTFIHMVPSDTTQSEAVQRPPKAPCPDLRGLSLHYVPTSAFLPGHRSSLAPQGWIPAFNQENAILLRQTPPRLPQPPPPPPTHCRTFLSFPISQLLSVVLKQKHVSVINKIVIMHVDCSGKIHPGLMWNRHKHHRKDTVSSAFSATILVWIVWVFFFFFFLVVAVVLSFMH